MKLRFSMLAALCAWAAADVRGAEPISEKNWSSHPAVVEIRDIYRSIKAAQSSGKLKKQQREFDYCEPYQDTRRVLFSDAQGRPRMFSFRGGSDDSSVQRELYYDEAGALRFAFITAGAVNGTRLEVRVYFAPSGKRIWEAQKLLAGPGYTFPTEWPAEDLITDPKRAFDEKHPCAEKPR